MKKLILLMLFAAVLTLSACEQQVTYQSNYSLDDVSLFKIHHQDMYPLFMIENEVFLLYSDVENIYDAKHNTRVAVLFENHSTNEDFIELEYKNITKDIPLQDSEEIIKVIDYFEGWLFLTNLGNVYKYETVIEPEMIEDFYIEGKSSLISLQEDEQIIDMYYPEGFQVDLLRFETSKGRYFDFEEANLNSIFGYELYDETIFLVGEKERITLLDWSNDVYFIITTDDRVLRYNPDTKDVTDQTTRFPMENGERIIAFNYESDNRKIYVTNFGRAVNVNLQDFTVYNEFYIDVDLNEDEFIVDYQRGYYGCKEGMALVTTNQDRTFILSGVDKSGQFFDTSSIINTEDSIIDLEMSYFGTHTCGTSSNIMYNGEEYFDFQYIIIVHTEQNHTYLIGFLSKFNDGENQSNYLIQQIK